MINFVCQRGLYQQVQDLDKLCTAEMKLACHKGAEAFRREGVALDAVVAAIAALEVRSGNSRTMRCRGCYECARLSTLLLSLPQVMHRHCKGEQLEHEECQLPQDCGMIISQNCMLSNPAGLANLQCWSRLKPDTARPG